MTSLVLESLHLLADRVSPSNILPMMACCGLSPFLLGSEDEEGELPCKRPKTETKQDYEEWKKQILEKAAKLQETKSTGSVGPPSNVTAACS